MNSAERRQAITQRTPELGWRYGCAVTGARATLALSVSEPEPSPRMGVRAIASSFYEINPAVDPIARNVFTYIRDSGALGLRSSSGDARTSLANEPPHGLRRSGCRCVLRRRDSAASAYDAGTRSLSKASWPRAGSSLSTSRTVMWTLRRRSLCWPRRRECGQQPSQPAPMTSGANSRPLGCC